MINNHDFFASLNVIKDLKDIVDEKNFYPIPDDWIVIVTDIENSTEKVESGQYKQVNTVGVSCIIAARNAIPQIEFPYVFGGDGASMVVPQSAKIEVAKSLMQVKIHAESAFGIKLRIAFIPVSTIRIAQQEIKVAKFVPSEKNYISFFIGGGISYAEKLMKSQNSLYLPPKVPAKGSLEGLECRWNPIQSENGGVLTIIIENRTKELSVLQEIYKKIIDIAPDNQPVNLKNIIPTDRPKHLYVEAEMKHRNFLIRFLYLFKVKLWLSLILRIVQSKKK